MPFRHSQDTDSRTCFKSIVPAAMGNATCLLLVLTAALEGQIESPAARDVAIADTDFFTTSVRCAECHSSSPNAKALRDAKGRSVAPSDLWPTSMMAHSSLDPLWRAVVAAEVAATPSRKAEIEAKCLRCHTPMASIESEIAGSRPSQERFLHGRSTVARLAADGVSCTACHQIPAEELGTDASFSGHFQIGRDGKIFGPHARPFAMPMYRHTGYVPTQSPHVRRSALCASCHTLITQALAADGSTTGHSLLEQGPYVEWQNSQFNDEAEGNVHAASCQDCHVPTTDVDGKPIKTRIVRNPHGWDFPPVPQREPFGRHVFTGGNTLLLSIIRAELAKAESDAAVAAMDAAIQRTRKMLREQTARLEFKKAQHQDGRLVVQLAVENLTGHKLPTAYPSRRLWIRLRVSDSAGDMVFASGEFDDRGRIVDAGRQLLTCERVGGRAMPHYLQINRATQVQIYEAVMEDSDGHATYSLLRGARYRKDNRLLPRGWKRDHLRGPMTAPVGTAKDTDFIAGFDTVSYIVDAPLSSGPYRVEAALLYQVLGARYAAELFTRDVPEMTAFRKLYDVADPRPELVVQKTTTVPANQIPDFLFP